MGARRLEGYDALPSTNRIGEAAMQGVQRGSHDMATDELVIDVGDESFEIAVLDRSHTLPVVVDFWAPWCGPCRTLGPVLEGLASEHAGAFLLAKVNVDAAPVVAESLAIRSIPTVIAFRGGQAVSEFVGAQPEPAVRRFIAALLPSETDRLVAEAIELASRGHVNAAEERLRAVLAAEPRHSGAGIALARVLGELGEVAEALACLERIVPGAGEEAEADRLAAELRTRAAAGGAGGAAAATGDEEQALLARLEADPGDLASRLTLGRLLAAAGRYEQALEALLVAVRQDAKYEDAAARKAMVDLFAVLGGDHPLTQEFRAKLAQALFR